MLLNTAPFTDRFPAALKNVGNFSARPVSGEGDGDHYYAADTGRLYLWILGAWVQVGGGNPRRARLTKSSTQAFASSSNNAVQFQSAAFDTNTFYSAGQPTRITIGATGIYQIGAGLNISVSGSPTGICDAYIRLNGSTVYGGQTHTLSAAILSFYISVSLGLVSLTAGDYLELLLSNQSSGTLTVQNAQGSNFWIMGAD